MRAVSWCGISQLLRPGALPQPCGRPLSSILGRSNLKFAGMPITLTVSTSSLNLMAADCKQVGGVESGSGRGVRACRNTDGKAQWEPGHEGKNLAEKPWAQQSCREGVD